MNRIRACRAQAPSLALALALALLALPGSAFADELARFERSRVSLSSYLGSGTFVAREFSEDPYFSQELQLEPRFRLGTELNARAAVSLECEFTEPDNNTGRRCSFSDVRLSFHDPRIVTEPLLGGSVHGSIAAYLPLSLESRFNHTLTNLRASGGYSAQLGTLELGYDLAIQKYLPSRHVRGMPPISGRSSAGDDAAAGSGGRMNDNWLFLHSLHAAWSFSETWTLTLSAALYDYLRFAVPEASSDPNLPSTGRVQLTSGTVDLAYRATEHLAFSAGLTSLQPALTADNQSLRFPFYDFISPTNNYSKWYLGATLTY